MESRERTLFLVKPDAMQRGLAGEIISRLERRGLRIAGMKLVHITRDTAEEHYGEHKGKSFYDGLVNYITGCPVIAIAWEGTNAVQVVRNTIGVTDPTAAAPGTIRGDLGLERGRNLVHASDSTESSARELRLFFQENELIDWRRDTDTWIFE